MNEPEVMQWIDKNARGAVRPRLQLIVKEKGESAINDGEFKRIVRNIPGGMALLKKAKPTTEKIESELKDYTYDLTGVEISDLAQTYGVSAEDVRKIVERLKAESHKEAVEAAAKRRGEVRSQAAKYGKSARSTDDSYYNSPIANEYARYAYREGQNSVMPPAVLEAMGKAAAVADFLPFPASLAGPALRTSQKGFTGQNTGIGGILADVAGSFIPDFVEKPGKLAWEALKGKTERYLPKMMDTKLAKDVESLLAQEDRELARRNAKKLLMESEKLENAADPRAIEAMYRDLTPKGKEFAAAKYRNMQERQLALDADAPEIPPELRRGSLAEDYWRAQLAAGDLPEFTTRAHMGARNDLTMLPHYPAELPDMVHYNEMRTPASVKAKFVKGALNAGGRKAARAAIGQRGWDALPDEKTEDLDMEKWEKDNKITVDDYLNDTGLIRQWEAGFKPKSGLLLDAWKLWDARRSQSAKEKK